MFILSILLSNIVTYIQNQKFEKDNKKMQNANQYIGTIISNPIQKESSIQYKVQITKVGNKSSNIKIYAYVKEKKEIEYGDEVLV